MVLEVDSSENNIRNSASNTQDTILGTLNTHLLTDHHIIRNTGFDSIAHWFSTNVFVIFMCTFQICSLVQIS